MIEFFVHVVRILLKSENIRKIVLNQSREQGCSFEITRILSDRLPFRRNRVLAVVPDIVVQNAEIRALGDLESRIECRASLRVGYRSVNRKPDDKGTRQNEFLYLIHYSFLRIICQ